MTQLKPPQPHKRLPTATAPGFLAIYDGQYLVGTIVERDGSHFAFGPDQNLVGEYRTRLEAVRALPRRVRT
jgi:hypothetical protein